MPVGGTVIQQIIIGLDFFFFPWAVDTDHRVSGRLHSITWW